MKRTIAFTMVALTTFVSCQKEKTTIQDIDIISVKSAKVLVQKYAQPIVSAGIITSDKEARLSFKVSGVIQRLYFKEGDPVTNGQLMATLYQTEISAQLQQAKNEYEKAVKKQHRIENLYNENAATAEELENSVSDVIATKQSYEIALFNMKHSSIYASQSGTVVKKHMNEDEIADIGETIYTINAAGSNDWVLKIGLSDKEWARIRKGDKATVSTDAYGKTEFDAVVSEIGSAADPVTGTFPVKLKINPDHHAFANGLAAKVRISPAQTQNLTFIPASAIVEADESTALVYSLNADRKSVTRRVIDIAFIENNRVAVRSGLDNVQDVITDGASYLSTDSEIKL